MTTPLTSTALGLYNSSLDLLGQTPGSGNPLTGRAGQSDGVYVNATTGNLVIQRQDEYLTSAGVDLHALRTYNSQGSFDDDNGDNWRIGFYRSLINLPAGAENTPGSTVSKVFGDGSEHTYSYDDDPASPTYEKYVSTDGDGAHDTLSFDGTHWTWSNGDSTWSETYNSAGQLVSVQDNDGNSQTYAYDPGTGLLNTVTDDQGQVTALVYNAARQLTQIQVSSQDENGVNVTQSWVYYTYDISNRLSQVIVDLTPDGDISAGEVAGNGTFEVSDTYQTVNDQTFVTTYTYDGTSTRVASITLGDGTSVAFGYVFDAGSNTYKVETVTDGEGGITRYTYVDAQTTDIKDPVGTLTRYTYDAQGKLTQVIVDPVDVTTNPNGKGLTTQYTYDADDNLQMVTDANGNQVFYTYDEQGNLEQRQGSEGNTVRYTYSSTNQILTETVFVIPDADGLDPSNTGVSGEGPSQGITTRYVYDAEDHLRYVISAEGRVTEYRYNLEGQRISTLVYTQDYYLLEGLAPTVALNESDLAPWVNVQDKSTVQRTDSAYTFRGQVDRVTSYTAVDAQGNGILDGTEAITQFIYDEHGQLLQTIDPRGSATTTDTTDYITAYTYDGLGRILSTSQWVDSSTTVTTTTTYDDVGNQLVTTLTNGLATTTVYDARGLLIGQSQADASGALGSTSYHYDAEGKLRHTINSLSNVAYLLYDDADRPVMTIDASGAVTETVYDDAGNVIQTLAYSSTLNSTTLAGLIDANGDPVVTTDSLIATLRANALGSADRSIHTLYDRANRAVMGLTPLDADATQVQVTQSFYDGAGRMTDTIAYATPIALSAIPATFLPDDVEPLLSTSADDRHSRVFYDQDGNLLATLDAEGYLTASTYDAAGQLIQTTAYATAVHIFAPDGTTVDSAATATLRQTGNLIELETNISLQTGGSDPQDRSSRNFYNARGQLIGQLDTDGYLTTYEYDLAGNTTSTTRYATVVGVFDINGNLDLVATVTLRSTGTLDALRPVASNNDRVTQTTYTALNQIATVTSTDGTVTQYTYDDIGNLIQTDRAINTTEIRTTQARYDSRGNVIGELMGEGSAALSAWLVANPSATPAEIAAQTDLIWNDYGIRHSYDLNNRRVSTTDQNGSTTWLYYDINNRLTVTIQSADGTVAADGTALTNVGEVTEVIYNAFGQVEQTIQYSNRIDTTALVGGSLDTALRTQLDTLRDTSASSQDRVTQTAYTLRGNVKHAIDAEGGWMINDYTVFGEVRQQKRLIEDAPFRFVTDNYVYDQRGQLIESTADTGGVARLTQTQYDAFGRITQTTDGNGHTAQFDYSYDTKGRAITTTTNALTHKVVTSYDAFGRTLIQKDALGKATQYAYDDQARTVTITTPELIEITTITNRHGETVSITDGNGIVTEYAYDNDGNLITVTEAKGTAEETITTTNTYDKANRTLTTEDANGTFTQFTYDAANRLLTRTVDPDDTSTSYVGLNLTTSYRYDALGNTIHSTDANGTATQTDYDKNGQVIAVTVDPYDATSNPDGLHLKTQYSYDAQGQTLSVTEGITRNLDGTDNLSEARTTEYRYDNLGRRTHTIVDLYHATDNPDGLHITTQYSYDKNDNLIQTLEGITRNPDDTDNLSESRTTRYVYDDTNQLRFSVDALGGITETLYDANGNVQQAIAYATALTATNLTALDSATDREGHLDTLISTLADATQDHTTRYGYDADNRLTQEDQAYGTAEQVTHTYVYDNNGKVIRQGIGDATRTVYSYTAYDALGRVARSIDGEGYVIDYDYDGQGNLTQQISYMNTVGLPAADDPHWASTAPDPLPNTDAVQGDRIISYAYDAAGRKIQYTDALGIITEFGYDALGRLTRLTEAKGLAEERISQQSYDSVGNLIEEISAYGTPEAATHRYTYDARGNQTQLIDPRGIELAEQDTEWAKSEREALGMTLTDANGTRAKLASELTLAEQAQLKALYTTEQRFDALNRKTQVIDPLGGSTTTDYDAFGNIVSVTDPNGHTGYYYYDANNRVTLSIDAEGYATQSLYDAFGNATQTINYHNQVQGSYDASSPIAIVDTAPAIPTSPYLVTDAVKDQVTDASYDALNRTQSITTYADATNSYTESFKYDAQGNVIEHQDKNQNVFSYEYDANNNKITETLPITSDDGTGTQVPVIHRYEYDARNNIIKQTEAYGLPEQRITQYVYDKQSNLVETVEPQVLVGVENLPMESGALEVGTGGTVNLTFSGGLSPMYLDLSFPPIIGYGSGNIKVIWDSINIATVIDSIPGDQTAVSLMTPWSATPFVDFLGEAYTVNIYKETGQGDVLITTKSGFYPETVEQWDAFIDNKYYSYTTTEAPSIIHFTGQPAEGQTMRVSYWPENDPNNISEVDLASYTAGTFSGMALDVLSGNYSYEAKVYNDSGDVLNHVTGTFSAIDGVVNTTIDAQPLLIGQLQTPHTYQTYDVHGNVTSETGANGNVTYHYYDASHRRIATLNAERYLSTVSYDNVGNAIVQRTYGQSVPLSDSLGNAIDLNVLPDPSLIDTMDATDYREVISVYDANNRLIETQTQEVLVYDRVGGQRTQTLVTHQQYDANGNVIRQTDANGNVTYFYYNKTGQRIAQVDALGYLTVWHYDAIGNVLQQTHYAKVLPIAHDSNSDPAALILSVAGDADDRTVVYSYDTMNRRISETIQDMDYSDIDATTGNLTAQTGDAVTDYQYDGLGNLTATIQANGAQTDYTYDGLSRQTREQGPAFTDAQGNSVRSTTEQLYNGLSNVIQRTNKGLTSSDDQITRYTYDPHGNIITETTALGGPTQYYYDLNGNITVKNERRSNPDGTAPAIDTVYTYDKLNQQTSTTNAKNFTEHATYNAYGQITTKGLNSIDQEYYEYDQAGRLIKTNNEDGITKAYLYDANGNATAEIQSGTIDTDLQALDISAIAGLDPTTNGIQRTESEYDANNQLIKIYEAPIDFAHDAVDIQEVWVNGLGNAFMGGTVMPVTGGTVDLTFSGGLSPIYLDLSFPPIIGYGDGNIKIVWETINITTVTGSISADQTTISLTGPQSRSFFDYLGEAYTLSIYKEMGQGDVLIAAKSGFYPETVEQWDAFIDNKYYSYTTTEAPSIIHFTGQPADASTLDLWLWLVGGTKPIDPISVSKVTTADGTAIDGWFLFDWTGYTAGDYQYEYKLKDIDGKQLDYVRGTLTLGDTPTVNSQEQYQIQPIVTPSTPVSNIIERTQTYNAFGDIIEEIDGRGNITNFTYNQRGQLVRKEDPETNATLEDGSMIRHRPLTEYAYDINGRSIGMIDANGNSNSQRYDDADHLVVEYHADGGIKGYGYDVFGNKAYVENELEIRTSYSYNAGNQLTRVDRPTDASFGTDALGNPLARFEEYRYDEAGRRIAHRNTNGLWEYTYYDDIGRVKKTVGLSGITTHYRYVYDPVTGGTKTITLMADGRTVEESKDYFDRLEYKKDLGNRTYRYFYNAAGWLVKQIGNTDPDSLEIATAVDLSQSLYDTVDATSYQGLGLEQYIDFRYYHNGYLSDIIDAGVNSHTKYEYDANGNRTFEGITQVTPNGGQVYYQWSEVEYDELNRISTIHDPKYDLSYEYDKNGNRRHVYARYHDGLNNGIQTQDYWYRYDSMNRFTVTKGILADDSGTAIDVQTNPTARGSGTITHGATGYSIAYNAASQRLAASTIDHSEAYRYNADGLLTETWIDDIKRAERQYDVVGNVKDYDEHLISAQGFELIDEDTTWALNQRASLGYLIVDEGTGLPRAKYASELNAEERRALVVPYTSTKTVNYSYTNDNKVQSDNRGGGNTTYYYDASGNLERTYNPQTGADLTTMYTYAYWDVAKQDQIKISGVTTDYTSEWKPGFSDFVYDANGHLTEVRDYGKDGNANTGDDRYLSYKLNHAGHILQRNELIGTKASRTQYYYYLNGIGVGDAGGFGSSKTDYVTLLASRGKKADNSGKPVSSADFDYNYKPINDAYPATTPGTYTVQAGDTLNTIALAVWGDASLWYLIADANGIDDTTELVANQNLVIPNVVANIHNNASTFKVYNPGELLGNTNPTLPDAPPPPQPDEDKGCGVIAQIIVIIVAVVVTIITDGALSEPMGELVAAVIGAAAGSVASQTVAVSLGLQEKFSWRDVATSALTAGITQGIDLDKWSLTGSAVEKGIVTSVIGQGVAILQDKDDIVKFSWRSVAASAISSPIKKSIGEAFSPSNATSLQGATWDGFKNDLMSGFVSGFVGETVNGVVFKDYQIQWASVAGNTLGTALGNALDADINQANRIKRANGAVGVQAYQASAAATALAQGGLGGLDVSGALSGVGGRNNGPNILDPDYIRAQLIQPTVYDESGNPVESDEAALLGKIGQNVFFNRTPGQIADESEFTNYYDETVGRYLDQSPDLQNMSSPMLASSPSETSDSGLLESAWDFFASIPSSFSAMFSYMNKPPSDKANAASQDILSNLTEEERRAAAIAGSVIAVMAADGDSESTSLEMIALARLRSSIFSGTAKGTTGGAEGNVGRLAVRKGVTNRNASKDVRDLEAEALAKRTQPHYQRELSPNELRAKKFSSQWQQGDLKASIQKFSGENFELIPRNATGKTIYKNSQTGVEVVVDTQGKYYRIYDPSVGTKRSYLDLNGKVPEFKLNPNGKKQTLSKDEYNKVTHFRYQ